MPLRSPTRWSALLLSMATLAGAMAIADAAPIPRVALDKPTPPPEWALWQRQLLEQLHPAALEFVRTYTRPDGTLIWRDEWPGMDGSDDGYESFYNFPLYYALGGSAEIGELAERLWDAVTRQFTAYGQVYREFDGYYDWMHHGESYVYFYFFGLANPGADKFVGRSKRFAGLYLGEDPEAPNYDPVRKLIRSPINGSRGPRFVNTAEDWVTHRDVLAHYPLPYDDIPNVRESGAWTNDTLFPFILDTMNRRMMRGDVPLNLTATSLILHAGAVTEDPKYRRWIEEYVGAWMERTRANNGILPDNVGLSGQIGETMDGKWWGGYYGWRWPHGLFNQLEATLIGGANALLATGDPGYLELPRSVLRLVEAHSRLENERVLVPNRYGDTGWYDYRPVRSEYLIHLWYLSQDPEDRARLERMSGNTLDGPLRYAKQKGDFGHEAPWLRFVEGSYPEYPVEILRANYAETLRRLQVIRADQSDPAERNVHHWQQRNPVILEGLVQTMLGGPNHIYHGGLLHCRVRYFDPVARRPGVPPEVAALVDGLSEEGFTVQLVNLHPSKPRRVILQAGAFGEHEFTRVTHAELPGSVHVPGDRERPTTGTRQSASLPVPGDASIRINGRWLEVELGPGAAGRLEIGMKRFAHPPRYAFPWPEGPRG